MASRPVERPGNYIIDIQDHIETLEVAKAALQQLAGRTLAAEDVAPPAELSVVLTDDESVRALNRAYRDTDAPTDVLSFAQNEGDAFARPGSEAPHLGDVIISIDTARRQAVEYGVGVADEVAHLLVHGILHLVGYDHERPDEARLMRAHEDAILGDTYPH